MYTAEHVKEAQVVEKLAQLSGLDTDAMNPQQLSGIVDQYQLLNTVASDNGIDLSQLGDEDTVDFVNNVDGLLQEQGTDIPTAAAEMAAGEVEDEGDPAPDLDPEGSLDNETKQAQFTGGRYMARGFTEQMLSDQEEIEGVKEADLQIEKAAEAYLDDLYDGLAEMGVVEKIAVELPQFGGDTKGKMWTKRMGKDVQVGTAEAGLLAKLRRSGATPASGANLNLGEMTGDAMKGNASAIGNQMKDYWGPKAEAGGDKVMQAIQAMKDNPGLAAPGVALAGGGALSAGMLMGQASKARAAAPAMSKLQRLKALGKPGMIAAGLLGGGALAAGAMSRGGKDKQASYMHDDPEIQAIIMQRAMDMID